MSNEALKENEKENKKPKIIIQFEPDPTFKEEFLEFVEEVLFWFSKSEKIETEEQI